jgi:hypothetical protein
MEQPSLCKNSLHRLFLCAVVSKMYNITNVENNFSCWNHYLAKDIKCKYLSKRLYKNLNFKNRYYHKCLYDPKKNNYKDMLPCLRLIFKDRKNTI